MSENLKTSGSDINARLPIDSLSSGSSSVSVVARRRMLLASLGRGSAVVAAAALPLKALAATPTVTSINGIGLGAPVRCTISGAMSGVHSKETITATCAGRKPSSYGPPTVSIPAPWPGSVNKSAPFNAVFTSSETSTLINIIQTNSGSDNAYWIAAYLNAQTTGSPASNFPYTPPEVVALFNGPRKLDALAFFKTYMSTL